MIVAALVFVSMLCLDFVWAQYTKHTADRAGHRAGLWAAAILPLNYVVMGGYLSNPWLLLPAMAGAYLGTRIATRT